MTDVDLAYTATVYPGFPGAQNSWPAPVSLTFGLALDSEEAASQVSLAFSLRVKQNN